MSLIPTEKSVKIENPKEFFADEVFIVNRKKPLYSSIYCA